MTLDARREKGNGLKPRKVEFELGDHQVRLETGRIARQATGAVMAHMDDTSVLCTVTAATEAMPDQSFFPLTVDYQERMYAAGRIPGGFFRREGRPSEKETLTCRLIDRPIRPLFPKGYRNEVHVIATVMSVDRDVDPDIVSMIGTSAALAISGVPFRGPDRCKSSWIQRQHLLAESPSIHTRGLGSEYGRGGHGISGADGRERSQGIDGRSNVGCGVVRSPRNASSDPGHLSISRSRWQRKVGLFAA